MQITSLWRYPVKSTAGVSVPELGLEPWGPVGDRRYAVVERDGTKVTARTVPAMLQLRTSLLPDGVAISSPDGRIVQITAPVDGPRIAVDFRHQESAIDVGDAAADLVSDHLGRTVRVVWQPDPTERATAAHNGGRPGEVVSLADSAPVLLVTEASLRQLQEWVGPEPEMTERRFRPNVVVDGDAPFAEDTWRTVRLGSVDFRVQGICDRCVLTTIDPDTQAKGKEPIRTLAQHRRWDGATWFGIWLVPQGRGDVRVGDPVVPVADPEATPRIA